MARDAMGVVPAGGGGWRELDEFRRDDAPRLAVDRDLELVRPQARDRVALLVHDGDVDRDELDAGLEDGLLRRACLLRRLRGEPGEAGRHADGQHETGRGGGRQDDPAAHRHAPSGSGFRGRFLRGRAREASTLKLASSPTTRSGWVGSLSRLKKRPSRVRT